MCEHELGPRIVRRLRNGCATAPEIAQSLATSETIILPVLERLRGDDIVEFMGGDWSLSETFKSLLRRIASVQKQ